MAFGAMVGAVRASMVPPGGVRPGVLPRDRCAHGEGYSFGAVIGDLRARNSSLEEECEYNADTAQAIANSLKDVPPQQESLWERYAKGITSEQDLRRLFQRRQSTPASTDPKLEIETATKVQNDQMLQRFESARLTPLYRDGFDDFLFHGSSQLSIANIIAQGLSTSRDAAHGRMLGVGIYGAPDPRKSNQYCRDNRDGRFMFLCRFNLSRAQHRQNRIYDEYCVPDERHVVVLWHIKLKG